MPLKKTQRTQTSVKEQPQSYVCLLRKLSRKSVIGFGSFRDLSVQQLLDTGRKFQLTEMYYQLDKITFLDDILEELNITDDWRIEKPGKHYQKFKAFKYNLFKNMSDEQISISRLKNSQIRKRQSRGKISKVAISNQKFRLQNKNQNK